MNNQMTTATNVIEVNSSMKQVSSLINSLGLIRVGVIGAGNAGCQTAQKAHIDKGFDAMAFNTSTKDLKNIVADIPKIIVGNERGAGKDRDVAIDFIYQNHKQITEREEVQNFINNNELIVVVSSTGGGSGSGMAFALMTIMRAYAKQKNLLRSKRFLMIHILPQNQESYLSLVNTTDYFKDIPDDNKVPFMSYDNNKYADLTPSTILSKVNQDIVDDLCVLRGDYIKSTPYESIDEEDLFRILEAPGRIMVLRAEDIKEKDLDESPIYDMLVTNHLRHSSATEIQNDGIIASTAVITNLNDKLAKNFNIYSPMSEFVGSSDSRPFPHVYKPQQGEANSVYIILSGLSRPTDRIKKIIERMSEIELETSKISKDDGFYELLNSTPASETPARISLEDTADDVEAMFGRIKKKR